MYLITGGAGFIGSHFVEDILMDDSSAKIVVLDNLSMGRMENIPNDDRVEFVNGDVSDQNVLNEVFEKYDYSYIIHLAAIASVQDSIVDPVKTHKVNFDSTLHIIEHARKQKNLKRMVFASSAAVYGDNPSLPCVETAAVNPITPYGVDKYASERYVLNASKLFNVPSTAFRFFNVYGPRQNPSSPYSGVISIFADRILNGDGKIRIFGDGEQTRDFVFVKDLVSIIRYSMNSPEAVGEVFNIGTGKCTSLNQLAAMCAKVIKKPVSIDYAEPRSGDIRHSISDISRLRGIGYTSEFTELEDGLGQLFESLR
ncbi:MAG TPA: NAD-dependent epimerase/dehydratase family protein [Spirochaetota bacterium]|nr:NAD-dependent epimerase/dehydratase family protein [Spirochaetota bacterium]